MLCKVLLDFNNVIVKCKDPNFNSFAQSGSLNFHAKITKGKLKYKAMNL